MEFFTCFIFWLFFLEGNKVETEDLTQIPTLTFQNSTSFRLLCELHS